MIRMWFRGFTVSLLVVMAACSTQPVHSPEQPVVHRGDQPVVHNAEVAGMPAEGEAGVQSSGEPAPVALALPQETGADVLRHIRTRYAGTETYCGTSTIPAFVCSGIIFRSTRFPTAGRYSWMPNPSSSTTVGVSSSFLRQDANMWNPYPSSNGFIVYPKTYADKYGATNLYVRCGYPQDAWTAEPEACTHHERPGSHTVTQLCHQYSPAILTAQQWYNKGFSDDENQCAFGFVKGAGMTDTAAAFMAMLGARKLLGTVNRNEIILDDYRSSDPKAFPLEAFFYQDTVAEPGYQDPLTNAKEDQKIYWNLTHRWVPIILWTVNKTGAQTFDYRAADQAVKEPGGGGSSPGEDVARHLQARYDMKDPQYQTCKNGAAAFVCSGVMIRGTGNLPPPNKPWMPAPGSTKGVSFSWMRKDSIVTTLYVSNGMITMPAQFLEAGKSNLQVLCGYIMNASTNGMANKCQNDCQSRGITTVAQFNATFPSGAGCPFKVAKGTANAAQMWDHIATIRRGRNYTAWNEIIIDNYLSMADRAVPVEAFYYLTGATASKGYAQTDQKNYKNVTGLWVPVIMVNLTAGGATFTYNAADQAITN
ncbi:hypothetical protein KR767_13655 [Luteibacter anthropi]|uniref:hypothetical protein n=1 Tax=Luteibacter anthropi TaxID=564369 RepID=UPI00203287B6|nr:hypothetical protein [Luteibacter anthropi]URX61128.1 hypothetical protein KR767_13655 [Luteibacter anthropi]